jgi:hypothetical protein
VQAPHGTQQHVSLDRVVGLSDVIEARASSDEPDPKFFFFFNCDGNNISTRLNEQESQSLSHFECSESTRSKFGAPKELTEHSVSGAEGEAEERKQ